jgi:hypothetical protein
MKPNNLVLRLMNPFLASVILLLMCQNLYGQAPAITGFTPISGPVGTTVTITGTNFNTTAANNKIMFGTTTVTASSATATQLTVSVPTGAIYSPITVLNTATKLSAFSPRYFLPTFTPSSGSIAVNNFSTGVGISTGEAPANNTLCDLDGDGKADLVVVNAISKTISVLKNTSTVGSITFAARQDIDNTAPTAGSRPYAVATGDLDGDGKQDLAVMNSGGGVSILKNTSSVGTISFASKVDFPTAADEFGASIAIGDFDGDGKPDVAAGLTAIVSVLRNTSTGGVLSFEKVDIQKGDTHEGISVGDMDGDGKPDIVVPNYLGGTVSVFRNTSILNTISFASGLTFNAVAQPRDVAIGDLDGDGLMDIAVPSYSTYGIDLIRNTSSVGNISFAPEVNIATGGNLFSVGISDLNGDGKPDVVVESLTGAKFYIYQNHSIVGSLAFSTRVEIPTGQGLGMSIGDVDGDGKSDLMTSIQAGNNVVIVGNSPVTATDPVITSFTPTSGPVGATVTINGTNFSATPANNTVSFNGTVATVTASTTTTITTTVPAGATTGKITATVGSATATSSGNFSVTCANLAKPTITQTGSSDLTSSTLTSSAAPAGGTYQWFVNNTAITGATSQSYSTADVGSYTVRITVSGGCNATSDPFIIIVTDTEQPIVARNIVLYPNPVLDWLTVSLGKTEGKKDIAVYEATGKPFKTHETLGKEVNLYVADYPTGMYIVKVSTSKAVGVLKFIKQ